MTAVVVLVALVNRAGAVLLRMRDEQSTVRANRWSLIGGGAYGVDGETPEQAAQRLVREQTGLETVHELRAAWEGRVPELPATVYLLAARTTATTADITVDDIPGALARRGEYFLEFVPGPEVQSGRSFTPASGYVVGQFLDSVLYRELAAGLDPGAMA